MYTMTGVALFARIFILISLSIYTVNSQELGHFNRSVTVDFVKNKIWAEIRPGEKVLAKSSTTSGESTETTTTSTTNITTPKPGVGANNKEVKTQTAAEVESVGRVKVVARETTQGGLGGEGDGRTIGKQTVKTGVFSEITSADLGGNTPPYIEDPRSAERKIITSGAQKSFHCIAKGNPTPVFTWYKDGKRLDASGEYVKAFQNGTLYFASYSSREDGVYHCTAVNEHGTDVSVKFQIMQGVAPKAQDKEPNSQATAEKDRGFSMPCGKVPPTVPDSYKRWYDEESAQYSMGERLGTDSQGTLHFAYTKLSDARVYQCGLAYGDIITFFNSRRLIVKDTVGTEEAPPSKAYVTPNGVKATLNKEFLLECFFSGKPIPRISWKNSSNHVITRGDPLYELDEFSRTLTIKNVRQEDEGTFKCTSENYLATEEATIKVNVTTPPLRTSESLRNYISPDKRDFTLTCKAKAALGERLEPPTWYRNGEVLTENNLPDPQRYSFSADKTELRIKDLVKTVDTASYQCSVDNSEGQLYMNGYLRVINALEIFKRPDSVIKVMSNSTRPVDISVKAKGDACCMIDVLYYFNQTSVALTQYTLSNPPFRRNSTTGELSFDPSSIPKEDLEKWVGDYKCRVSNKHESKVFDFIIVTEESNRQPITAAEASTGLWWIYILLGVLAIAIVFVVVIVIYKSNYPGETYQLEKTELKHHLNPEEDLLNQSFQEI